jgi:hypothetical protein
MELEPPLPFGGYQRLRIMGHILHCGRVSDMIVQNTMGA